MLMCGVGSKQTTKLVLAFLLFIGACGVAWSEEDGADREGGRVGRGPGGGGGRRPAGEHEPVAGQRPAVAPEAADAPINFESLPEIDWWAANQSFDEAQGAIILSGTAWVRYLQIKLEADHIVFFRKTRELYAEGHIRLREGESEIAAEVAYVDMPNDRGYMLDATVRVSQPPKGGLNSLSKKTLKTAEKTIQNRDQAYNAATQGDAAFISIKDPNGIYLDAVNDPQARTNIIFKADKMVRASRLHYYAANAFVTNDEMAAPMYGIKVDQLDFFLKEYTDGVGGTILKPKSVRGKGARAKIGPVTLFPLPTVSYDLTKHLGYFAVDYGKSSRYGYYGMFRYGTSLGTNEGQLFDPSNLYIDLDERWARGPAAGAELKYFTGRRPEDPEARAYLERGKGSIRVYGIWESQISDSDDINRQNFDTLRRQITKIDGTPRRTYYSNILWNERRLLDQAGPGSTRVDTHKNDLRGEVDFKHHQPLRHFAGLNDVEVDFKVKQTTDRDYYLEYMPNNYYKQNTPEALASVRKAGDNYSTELLYRSNPQGFDPAPPRDPLDLASFTQYEPAFTYNLFPTAVGHGAYLSSEAQVGFLSKQFDQDVVKQDDLTSGRAYGKMELERPTRLGAFTLRPWLGGQLAGYTSSRDGNKDGGGLVQGAAMYGMDLSTRIYATMADAINPELGVTGFRHIIEPRIEYRGISDTIAKPVNVYDFDSIDDLHSEQRFRFAIDQTFQTRTSRDKNDPNATRNFAGLNMYMDAYPRHEDHVQLFDGTSTDLFHVNGFLSVLDALTFSGDLGMNVEHHFEVETAVASMNFNPGGRWNFSISERFNYSDSGRDIQGFDLIYFTLNFQLSERWGLSWTHAQQRKVPFLGQKGTEAENIQISRKWGPIIGQFRYSYDRINHDHGTHFTIAPAFAYRNLIVPQNNLLVDASQVEGADDFKETRNFDPFNLSNKKKKVPGSGPAKTDPNAAPAPPAEAPAPEPENNTPKTPAKTSSAQPGTGGDAAQLPPMPDVPQEPRRKSQPTEASRPSKPKSSKIDADDWTNDPTTSASR